MKHIVAVGGGEIGRPGYPVETTKIDKQIIALAGKPRPKVLFIPTASGDSPNYVESFIEHYGKRLGCDVSVLNLYSKPTQTIIRPAINEADIIYVGGGNTLKMMTLWRRMGIDKMLAVAYKNGTVLSGLSAGAICWFDAGLSDSRSFTSSKGVVWDYINVRGLGLEGLLICPHYDAEPQRQPSLKNSLIGTRKVALALDNCAALEIKNDTFRILSSRPNAKAYKTYWLKGEYTVDEIQPSKEYMSLEMLRFYFSSNSVYGGPPSIRTIKDF
jgi:dipeptidase E